jgi:hypothetical protein
VSADRPIFSLLLKAEPTRPGGAPPVTRLRSALKVLLRAFGLRALSVKELPSVGEDARPSGRGQEAVTSPSPATLTRKDQR